VDIKEIKGSHSTCIHDNEIHDTGKQANVARETSKDTIGIVNKKNYKTAPKFCIYNSFGLQDKKIK